MCKDMSSSRTRWDQSDPASLPFQAKAILSGLVLMTGMMAAICFVSHAPKRSTPSSKAFFTLRQQESPTVSRKHRPKCIPPQRPVVEKSPSGRPAVTSTSSHALSSPAMVVAKGHPPVTEKKSAAPHIPKIDPSVFEAKPAEPVHLEKSCPLFPSAERSSGNSAHEVPIDRGLNSR